MELTSYLSLLTVDDIPFLQQLEEETNLSFWGRENYRKFLEEFPEYFGCKVTVWQQEEYGWQGSFSRGLCSKISKSSRSASSLSSIARDWDSPDGGRLRRRNQAGVQALFPRGQKVKPAGH